MLQHSRHQCLIYDGAPSRHLKAMAAVIHEKLAQNVRCLYLNSAPMVAGMRSFLAAAGVDVACETERGSLVLTSQLSHLNEDGRFDVDWMMETLCVALEDALGSGFVGLWATGDMSWEFGPEKNFSKLLDYELRLEQFIRDHAEMSGVCQYHADTLPREAMRHSLVAHPSIFVNETLSLVNPHFLPHAVYAPPPCGETAFGRRPDTELDGAILRLCQQEN
jgi:hypothetical protein